MKLDSLLFDYDDAGRPEILESVNSCMARYLANEKCTGLMLAPRTGKQSIVVLLANEARAQGAPFVHAIAPWTNLAYQLKDGPKNAKTFKFYGARGTTEAFRADVVESIPHHKYYCAYENQPTLLTSTVHLLHSNVNTVVEAVKHAFSSSGKRPVFIIDETQLIGIGMPWHETVMKLMKAGAYVVSMTGTEKRLDKKLVAGFEYQEIEEEKKDPAPLRLMRNVRMDEDGKRVAEFANGTLTTTTYKVVPIGSEPVPISHAFEKGWCSKMDVKTFDFDVADLSTGAQFKISEASQDLTSPNLISWLQSEECVRVAVKHVIDDLVRRRVMLGLKDAKAMFITLSDTENVKKKGSKSKDEGANYHARKIRDEFLRQLSLLPKDVARGLGRIKSEICTSMLASGEPDNSATEKLRRFTLTEMDKHGNEPIDVLFVKNMGVVGLDAPQLKTMANLSNSSADSPTTIQANLRIVTKWNESDTAALLILPAHYHALKFRDQCGRWSNKIKVGTFEEESIDEVILQDKEKADYEVVEGSGRVHSYSTHTGEIVEDDMEDQLIALRKKYKVANAVGDYMLITMIKEGLIPAIDAQEMLNVSTVQENTIPGEVVVIDVDEERKEILKQSESFGKKAGRLANKLVNYQESPEEWRKLNCKLVAKAKSRCGISKYQTMQDIVDPVILKKLITALDEVYQELKLQMSYCQELHDALEMAS
jgi:hypothetical protein